MSEGERKGGAGDGYGMGVNASEHAVLENFVEDDRATRVRDGRAPKWFWFRGRCSEVEKGIARVHFFR